jgi:glutamate racemase
MTKIGFFDSGIGGLFIMDTVAKEVPGPSYYYISDEAFFPYGSKTEKQIIERSNFLTEVLLKEGIRHIVVACNTATAVAIDLLREKYPQVNFIGVEPYINIINKEEDKAHEIAVLVTPSTATSSRFLKLKKRLDPKDLVDVVPLENLAALAEEIFYKGESPTLVKKVEEELSSIKGHYHHVILGCTHYLHIEKMISDILGAICISPATAIANRVKDKVGNIPKGQTDKYRFLSTSKNIWEDKSFLN